MADTNPKTEVYEYVKAMLGDGMVTLDLDPIHYDTALKKALGRYRQVSSNSVEEAYVFMVMKQDQNIYTLPDTTVSVRQVFRRSYGGALAPGMSTITFDPFQASLANMYILQAGGPGGLATYELYAQYTELAGKMFGANLNFVFDPGTHKITFVRRIAADEEILMWVYNAKADEILLRDYRASVWLKDYTLAICKQMLGEARSKYGSLPGPQGGINMNGDALKSEAADMIQKLEDEIINYRDHSMPLSFIIG